MDMKEGAFKLLIDNALLEQEKRLSSEFRREMSIQTERFTKIVDGHNGNVMQMNKSITELEVKLDALKIRIWAVGAVCTGFGGFLGFVVARVVG